MNPTKLGLEIVGGLTVLFTLIPLIRHDYWTFRVFEYPRLQKLALNLVILCLFVLLIPIEETVDYVFISVLIANAIYLFYQIFPFTFLARKVLLKVGKRDPENGIRILSSNVFQDNENTEGCLRLIAEQDPDIVLLLETNRFWFERTKSLMEKYPHNTLVPLENTYGMLLYSKLELVDPKVRYLVDEEIPSITTNVKLRSGKEICLYCVHPTPPVPGENSHSTERDKELLLVAKEVKKKPCPTIVVGDLNDVAWSYTTELFTKISGLLDPTSQG
jgi:endonuclease/exonuclease/phosphatase (EEP) superfamily protein YafD